MAPHSGLAPALLLDGALSAGLARSAVAPLAPTAYVVVVDRTTGRYALHQQGTIVQVCARVDDATPLARLLRMDELVPAATMDLRELDDPVTGWQDLPFGTVLLNGSTVAGVVVATGGTRGESQRRLDPLHAAPPAAGPEIASAPAPTARFRAYPQATGPAETAAGVPFELRIGFRVPPDPAASETPVIIADAPPDLIFEVQADGFGFTFPDGNTRSLQVRRDHPDAGGVALPVLADEVPVPMARSIEVQFSYGGGPVGVAYCDLTVHPAGTDVAAAAGGTSTGGGTAFGALDGTAADLTVTISAEPGRPTLHWLFQSPHPVQRPTDQVVSELPEGSGVAFAGQIMRQLPDNKGSALLDNTLRGLGVPVADAMPPEFWRTLDSVWGHVQDRTPTLQLITNEPFVPWELAWVEPGLKVRPERIPAGRSDLALGSLWAVGRWPKAAEQPFGDPRPVSPPETVVEADAMVVVVGDYTDGSESLLPEAVAEGNTLALTYGAKSIGIDEASLTGLMEDALTDGDGPFRPGVVHVAAHGKVGLQAQQYTGIVMKDGRLLSPFAIQGSQLGSTSRPFVFLNACQVGTASTVLNSYSGLAGAFLVSGCRGFVAPLWDVDDDVAHRLSLDFYRMVLDEEVPVGEAVRRLRAGQGAGDGARDGAPTATPMAYVFYGNPALRLQRTT